MRTWGVFIFGLLLWMSSVGLAQAAPATQSADGKRAAIVSVEGEINDFTARAFASHVAAAKAAGAGTIILRLNTPGGAVVSALDMSRRIKDLRADTHVVAYVDKMALSAGAMLAIACDEIVMRPNSLLGDCAPILVSSGGLQSMGAAERAKMESPILAEFYDSAERSGYDRLLVSAMVQYGVVVHVVDSPTGQRRFVNDADYAQLLREGWKPAADLPDPLDGAEQLLTVNNTVAQKIGLSKGSYASPATFAQDRGYAVIASYDTTFGESLIGLLGGPEIRGVLGIVFMLSLYTSFSKPATGVPEVIAMVAGVLLFGVPLLTGYASWFEILLIVLGVLLLALELFVIPGFGVAGLSGIVLVLVGFVLTFAPPEPGGWSVLPRLQGTRDALVQGFVIATIAMVSAAGLWLWLARYLHNIPYMNRLILSTSVGTYAESADLKEAADLAWPAVGAMGRAITPLRPGGVARFFDPVINDERNVDVVSDLGLVTNGSSVVVRAKEGKRIVVRPAPASSLTV